MNSPESFSQNQEKSQTEIRENFERKLNTLISSVRVSIEEYEAKLKDGSFEDKDGEPEGLGEKRKQEMEHRISSDMDRVEAMKAKLDSGEEILDVVSPEILSLNVEKALVRYTALYQETDIPLPNDFNEQVLDIWSRNSEEIQKAIEEKGFDDMIIAPANIPLAEIAGKMKMENGYYFYQVKEDFSGTTSQGVDKVRIILVHKAQNLSDNPELAATKGIKVEDINIDESLSLEDYIILQRNYFKETGKHLDVDGWTWTPRTKSGPRFVFSRWDPAAGKLDVYAGDPAYSNPALGCRASRYFS